MSRASLATRAKLGVLVAALAVGCAPPPQTDEERLARIEEMVAEVEARFPSVPVVTVEDVGRLLEKDSVVLVDVREAREREVSTIPGAIAAEVYEANPDAYGDVAVVAYCTIGHRSSQFAERLAGAGHEVFNLRGSILSWTHSGAPLVGPEGPTRSLHVFGTNWNLAPSAYEATW